MDDFKDSEIKAMTQLHKDMVRVMMDAMEDGMAEEHAIHVSGNVALLCMEKWPNHSSQLSSRERRIILIIALNK